MRADRLVATLLLLQSRTQVTAAELARELEVSTATARRDLEALSAAGIPVYSTAGRGGGWSLLGGARTDLTGLSAPEAQALFLLLGPAASADPRVKSALRKLVRALPGTFRAAAEAAADAVVVDPVRWGDRDRSRPPLVDVLQGAIVERRQVSLEYAGRTTGHSRRHVHPWGLADKDGLWYFLAGTDQGQRTFRVDRIVEATVTDLPSERPVDFELAEAWEQVVAEVEIQRSTVTAVVLIEPRLLPVLQTQFGRHCVVDEAGPDVIGETRSRAAVSAPTPLMIAQYLAGWGSTVEVLGPPSVQAELARLGGELVARYQR